MEISRKSRRALRLQGIGFALLFLAVIGLLGWLSTRYHYQADWTANGRNSLSATSVAMLDTLKGPVTITAFARKGSNGGLRKAISELIGRYQRHDPRITLKFVDPDMAPDQVRQAQVTANGELVLTYQGRTEHLKQLTEQGITNALQRLARGGHRHLVFLGGHGERSPLGHSNRDLGRWGEQLKEKGFDISVQDLATEPTLPADTRLLVIADPQVSLLPGEVKVIADYLDHGGNLLWLGEPGQLHGLAPLAHKLGVTFLPGMVVDPTTRLLGINNPAFAIVARYPQQAITEGLDSLTLFPEAAALKLQAPKGWTSTPFLTTVERSWDETGPIAGTIQYDADKGDTAGPLTLGVALTHPTKKGAKQKGASASQRVVITGDGDFLSNTYLGNGANQALGDRIVNWLSHDDTLIHVPPKVAPDTKLVLTPLLSGIIGIGFLGALPLLLVASGVTIWLKRRKR